MPDDALKSAAKGKWKSILSSLGVDGKLLDGKHHSCPGCGGNDRFRFTDYQGAGLYICNQCGAGDGIKLLAMSLDVTNGEAMNMIRRHLGVERDDDEVRRARSLMDAVYKLWNTRQPDDGTLREYLMSRGLSSVPRSLGYSSRCRYNDENGELVDHYPAMLARIHNKSGRLIGIHRTYLHPDAAKRRKVLGRARAGAVWLHRPRPSGSSIIGVTEGIETAMAVRELAKRGGNRREMVATLSYRNMEQFELPDSVKARGVVVYADNDGNMAGQAGAYALAHKLKLKGADARVAIPKMEGDWLDVLNTIRAKEAAES